MPSAPMAETSEVVDLSVKDEDIAGLGVDHRLAAVVAEIDDRKTPEGENRPQAATTASRRPKAARVGPSVQLRGVHSPNRIDDRRIDRSARTGDPAHR